MGSRSGKYGRSVPNVVQHTAGSDNASMVDRESMKRAFVSFEGSCILNPLYLAEINLGGSRHVL